MSAGPGSAQPSTTRLAAGCFILLSAVAAAVIGFVGLGAALNAALSDSSAFRNALFLLGAAGGGIAIGVCLLIWEGSVRLAKRTE